MERERLGSRLGFLLISAGCAIGCGNVWKFPWLCGENGGGTFVLLYICALLILGIPVMIAELALGRAAQASPVKMYQQIEKSGQKWHIHGVMSLIGLICLMTFYTVVCGWIINCCVRFASGNFADLTFSTLIQDPVQSIFYLLVTVAAAFVILSFNINKGLESVTKYMMLVLFVLLIMCACRCIALEGGKTGLSFYLLPDFSKISIKVTVAAFNQAFFSLSLGIGSMAIFGSYIDKKRRLANEAVVVAVFDTAAAILAGLIIFPVCFTYNLDVNDGPGLLFNTLSEAFRHMNGGRIWGTIFYLLMVFAAFSSVLAVCEAIVACVRDLTGWNRSMGSIICGIGIFLISLTTALGFNVWQFHPFGEGTSWLNLWDYIVSYNLLPLGALIMSLFCSVSFGWGWDNFIREANQGCGIRLPYRLKYLYMVVIPILILIIYITGQIDFWSN